MREESKVDQVLEMFIFVMEDQGLLMEVLRIIKGLFMDIGWLDSWKVRIVKQN